MRAKARKEFNHEGTKNTKQSQRSGFAITAAKCKPNVFFFVNPFVFFVPSWLKLFSCPAQQTG